ncbi:very short patch repair endonuclease [Bradyrhizobium sp. SZCCHNRI3052]|uniref:very short patch repair endonuclease n=1 Tax=Bradyrhizobium sp. SZCCHNRI3052 TaxID=3057295 RepID=UPI002915FE18|nr:very short patch repair endonuclease [Bradyrhizobium sp. SZCCHNRI3052]
MPDFLTPEQRSERMSRIRSRDTKPELVLRRELHRLGLRYTLGNKRLPGKPDIVLPRHKAAVFVHGCFWHRHAGCNIATTPKSNTPYWQEKFDRNVSRDARVRAELESQGWRVFTVWECELQSGKRTSRTAYQLADEIRGAGTRQNQSKYRPRKAPKP